MKSFVELFDLIGILARRRYQIGESAFAKIGLNHTEARLLSVLNKRAGSATQDTLSNCLTVDRSNSGRALKRLEQQGYIVRHSHDSDKRTKVVQITSKGRRAMVEIAKLRKKMAQDFFGELTGDDANAIVNLLRKTLKLEYA